MANWMNFGSGTEESRLKVSARPLNRVPAVGQRMNFTTLGGATYPVEVVQLRPEHKGFMARGKVQIATGPDESDTLFAFCDPDDGLWCCPECLGQGNFGFKRADDVCPTCEGKGRVRVVAIEG